MNWKQMEANVWLLDDGSNGRCEVIRLHVEEAEDWYRVTGDGFGPDANYPTLAQAKAAAEASLRTRK
jgi:hypothetical protein